MDSTLDTIASSNEWNATARQYIAGGVVSMNRKVDPPIVFNRASGSFLYDTDGNRYIDYHAAFSPHLLGHNDPVVNQAVREALEREWSLMGSGTTPWEVELARLLCESIPSVERVQLTNTGSEATAHAIRLSRSWTQHDDVLLTLGGYNGWHNEVARTVMPTLEDIGPRVSPGEYRFLPASAGIPKSTMRHLHVVNFNDLESVEYVLRRNPIACVLTEPVLQNVGIVPPRPGYLEDLSKMCHKHGSLLVFDEVKTGFRSALGGYQSLCRVSPDISVFGKAVANGYPMGVVGGKAEIMGLFADRDASKRVLIAGTYNAHPVGSAAAIATLGRLQTSGFHDSLEKLGQRLEDGLDSLFREEGISASISRVGSAFCAYFMDHIPVDWHDILEHHDFEFDDRYRKALIQHGVYHFPLPCKQGSISAAHTKAIIDETLERTRQALKDI